MSGKVRKMKLSGKIAFTTLLIALAVSMIASGISIVYMKNYLLSVSHSHTRSVAQTAAASIDGDLISGIQTGEENGEAYQTILTQLQNFLLDEEIEYIYTMRKDGDIVSFVVDADTEEGALIGEEYESYDKIDEAFAGNITLDDEVTTDEWGSFYSAFAPITNPGGDVVAIVGVDCSIDSINEKINRMFLTLFVVEIICMIAAFIISLLTGQLMARNVMKINRKMEELAGSEGDLTQNIQVQSGDELENVANSFNSFIVKLRNMMLSVKDSGERLEESTTHTNQDLTEAADKVNQIVNALNDITQAMQETSTSVSEIQEATLATKEMSATLYEKTRSEADHAAAISQTADQAKQTCEESMNQMRHVVSEISDTLTDKMNAAQEIKKIIALTDDIISISSQTQLLALNASIEAARAGADGRGFAVVAEEISKLADSTAVTAKEIEQINHFTVDTYAELIQTSEKLIQYLDVVVRKDYDQMVEIGQSYHKDSVEFMDQFQEFSRLSEQLSSNMSTIENHIAQIMMVIEKETIGVTNAAGTSENIHSKMQAATNNGRINEEIVQELSEMLDKFIV